MEDVINKFTKVIQYSQNLTSANCEDLIKESFKAKSYFISMFNGLIFEVPETVSFELNEKEKLRKVSEFCDSIESKYQAYELSIFIDNQKDSFYSNRVDKDYVMVDGTIIPKGMKLLRAFKFFEDNENLVRKLQDEASEIIQQDKISGKLCFSVHPLDFLSSSENNHNWRSCHALDGDFRAGNLSYMLDDCTFMVYLKSKENTILPNFPQSVPWNDKKWRTLMFLNDNKDMMFAGRQYPFSSDTGIDYVKECIEKYFPKMKRWTPWKNEKIKGYNSGIEPISLSSPYVGVGNKLVPMRTLVKDASVNPLHFNDLIKSSCYDPIYTYQTYVRPYSYLMTNSKEVESTATLSNGRFIVGHDVKCLCCGQRNIELPEIMTCIDCEIEYGNSDSESFEYCPRCGRRFYYDDGTYVEATCEQVCPTCGDDVVCCYNCGKSDFADSEEMIYDREEEEYYCSECYELP